MTNLKNNPSKADEVAHLAAFVASLPADSYLRPWLSACVAPFEHSIRSDIIPFDLDPVGLVGKAKQESADIIAYAKRQAQAIEHNANTHAKSLRFEADAYVARSSAKVRETRDRLRLLSSQLLDVSEIL